MKKCISILLILVMSLTIMIGLTGCGDKNETVKSESEKENVKITESKKEKVDLDAKYKDMDRIDLKSGDDTYGKGFSVTLGYAKGSDWKKDEEMYSSNSSITLISDEHKMRVEIDIDKNQIRNYEDNLERYKEKNDNDQFGEFTTKDGYKGFYRYDYNGVQKDMLVGSLRLDEVSKNPKSSDMYRQLARVNFKVYRANGVASERIDIVNDFVIAELFENLTFEIDD